MATDMGTAAQTAVAALREQSTRASTSLADENAHKRHFLQTFRRWEALFKRADRGDVQAEKWLIADYYKSLGFLSPVGLEALTDVLKERYTFFPTIRECLEITRPKADDFGSPFYRMRHLAKGDDRMLIAPPVRQQELLANQTTAKKNE